MYTARSLLPNAVKRVLLFGFFFTLLLTGNSTAKENDITVSVLLFSGRPDPVYSLDDQALLSKLKNSIRGIPRIEDFTGPTVIPAKLGYKGILIQNPRFTSNLPEQLAIYNGKIEIGKPPTTFLVDKDRQLEKLFLQKAISKNVLDPKVLSRMKNKKVWLEGNGI